MNEKEKLREILRQSESIRKQDSWLYWMLAIIITLLICNFITFDFYLSSTRYNRNNSELLK